MFQTPNRDEAKKIGEDNPYFDRRNRSRGGSRFNTAKKGHDPLNRDRAGMENHTALNKFLKDQICSSAKVQSRKGNGLVRSTASQGSSRRNNALIEMAAQQSKAKAKEMDAESFAANVIRMSNYQSDPLAATMRNRTLGLSKLNVSKDEI